MDMKKDKAKSEFDPFMWELLIIFGSLAVVALIVAALMKGF